MRTKQEPIKSGYGARTEARDAVGRRDLTGKVAIVTGGYSGLGLETTKALAGAGAIVVVPARTPEKAQKALVGIANVEQDRLVAPQHRRARPLPPYPDGVVAHLFAGHILADAVKDPDHVDVPGLALLDLVHADRAVLKFDGVLYAIDVHPGIHAVSDAVRDKILLRVVLVEVALPFPVPIGFRFAPRIGIDVAREMRPMMKFYRTALCDQHRIVKIHALYAPGRAIAMLVVHHGNVLV
jgi:hypothetical protein